MENVTLELSNKEFLVKDLNEEIEEKKKTINLQKLQMNENEITIVDRDETIRRLQEELDRLRPRSIPVSEPVGSKFDKKPVKPVYDEFWKSHEDTEKEFNCKLEGLVNANELWITQARKS